MFKPSNKVRHFDVEKWASSLTPEQRAAQDALIRQSEIGGYRWDVPNKKEEPPKSDCLSEHPLSIFLPKHVNQEHLPSYTDPVVAVSEGITSDGREVVNEWRGRRC